MNEEKIIQFIDTLTRLLENSHGEVRIELEKLVLKYIEKLNKF